MKRCDFVNKQHLVKLRDWCKNCDFQRYLVIQSSEYDALLLVAVRDSNKHLLFELVRIFNIGNKIEISVDKSIDTFDCTEMFDSVAELIKTAIRVL